MTQHTPGPWHEVKQGQIRYISNGTYMIASMSMTNTDNATNGRLMAAAPDLLAALKDVRDAYQSLFDVMPAAWQTYDDIVEAAIAKAEG